MAQNRELIINQLAEHFTGEGDFSGRSKYVGQISEIVELSYRDMEAKIARKKQEIIEAALIEGLESGDAIPLDFGELRREARELAAQQKCQE